MRKHWKRTLSLLAVAAAVGLVCAGLALANKPQPPEPPPPPPPPELPAVRYRINFPALPLGGIGQVVNDINNLGYVVGWYGNGDGNRMAFLYDPTVDQVLDVNTLITAGLPDGWHLGSIVAINDWLVAVGYIHQTDGDVQVIKPVAVDLAMPNPVVDLLPDSGADFQMAVQINEDGDIVGTYQNPEGRLDHWVFNPGLYGDPLSRVHRDGTPLDMSQDIPELLPFTTAWLHYLHLNNPVGDRPAQVAGEALDHPGHVVFRYTLGDASPEFFDVLYSGGPINDAGTLLGTVYVPRNKKTPAHYALCRYNPTWEEPLDVLPSTDSTFTGINSSGDIYGGQVVYRDGWGYVAIDDLVVGTADELALWFSQGGGIAMVQMNDRYGQVDAAQIAGRISVTGAQYPILFILTPEPAPPDE